MVASTLINPMVPVLKLSDTISDALGWMEEHYLDQLPVVDNLTYKGIVTKDLLEAISNDQMTMGSILPQFADVWLTPDLHIFDAIRVAKKNGLRVLAILDDDHEFLGSIPLNDLLLSFMGSLGAMEKGAVLVLELAEYDYSLAEISRHIEANNAKVVSSFYNAGGPGAISTLTLKLNRTDISAIVATLERFGYKLLEAHSNEPIESIDQERLDMLMRYLQT